MNIDEIMKEHPEDKLPVREKEEFAPTLVEPGTRTPVNTETDQEHDEEKEAD